MKTRIFWITQNLAIMPKPNADKGLEEDMVHFKNQKVNVLVSLLTKEENFDVGLHHENLLCQKYDIEFISFPILDRSVPNEAQTENLKELAQKLAHKINQDEKMIVHCRGGIGRAGMLCAAILIELGTHKNDVIEKISKARGVNIPDTTEQKDWIINY